MTVGVQVLGLREFSAGLRRVDRDLSKQLRQVNKEAAEDVARYARAKASALGGVQNKAAGSLRPGGTQRGGYVKLGGNRFPFALGAEFGSIRFKQFPAWRGSGADAGYFLYPALRKRTQHLVEKYGDEIERLSRHAFPD